MNSLAQSFAQGCILQQLDGLGRDVSGRAVRLKIVTFENKVITATAAIAAVVAVVVFLAEVRRARL